MKDRILEYCEKYNIEYLLVDFFGTIVQRNCTSEEIKHSWAKKLARALQYTIDEAHLLLLRKKSEQAVISRAEAGEFGYGELIDEIYRRIIVLDPVFQTRYSEKDIYEIAHQAEIRAELESQRYVAQTIELINAAYSKGIRINIVSDFYLGQYELKAFLEKDDVCRKIDNIFVSSDCKVSKHQGKLYEYVRRYLGTEYSKCIMVGDNLQSDIQKAEVYGIKGFLVKQADDKNQHVILEQTINSIAKCNVSGVFGYSNYCFLLYLYAERLYKTIVYRGIKDIYFLSREGEFLKKIFDLYLARRSEYEICTHYLYVSRKATYPATLKALNEEDFHLLRKIPALSLADFFENIGMSFALKHIEIESVDSDKPIPDFFNSDVFHTLCARKDFQKLYETSRICYNHLFKRYCTQAGIFSNSFVALVDVGWNGTMQDNIDRALDGVENLGIYIGLNNSAELSPQKEKIGLIFSENPMNSRDLELWKYDHSFLERVLCASHGATDHYKENNEGIVVPTFREYAGEVENYEQIKPIQDVILNKIANLDDTFIQSCYCVEDFYNEFLKIHLHMVFIINNKQLSLQRNMIKGQMQNFGHLTTAGSSIGKTFSRRKILKKMWSNLRVLKNTETMFRILLNYNQKFVIKVMYYFRYATLKGKVK